MYGVKECSNFILLHAAASFPSTTCFLNRRKTALQCCVGFYCTTMQISHNYIYTIYIYINKKYIYHPSLLSLVALRPSHPLGHHRASGWAPCVSWKLPTAVCFMHDTVYMSVLLSQLIPPSLSPTVTTSTFSMSVLPFLPCK